MTDVEQIMETNEQFEHLKMMKYYDYLNRFSILNSQPIYGKDLKKAVKVHLNLSNLYQKLVKYGKGEISSSIFNTFCRSNLKAEQEVPCCKCSDIDNNDIPVGCSIVQECVNKKASEKRKINKLHLYRFDPAAYASLGHYFQPDFEEEKKLVITIEKDFLKNPLPIVPITAEAKPLDSKLIVPMEEPSKENEKLEEIQAKALTEPIVPLKDEENKHSSVDEDSEEQSEFEGYLTRSKKKNLEQKQQPTPQNDVRYNGVSIELIPAHILESIQHSAGMQESGKEEMEDEIKEVIPQKDAEEEKENQNKFFAYRNTDAIKEMIKQPNQRQREMQILLRYYKVIQPKTLGVGVKLWPSSYSTIYKNEESFFVAAYRRLMGAHFVQRALRIANFLTFPDRKLIQYDSGKLQKMSLLLKRLRNQNSKVLIFTQMSKVLDIIESFLNLHGYTYVRLDGSIRVEIRQNIVDRFNNDPRIFCFISSTRCGGIGINLTAADAVIFFDSDWNPAMDKQAQDRCHRIGQTKTVHIYRLITMNTIEENIFKKSLQKREMGGMIMEDGKFDTEFFQKINFKDVVEEEHLIKKKPNILEKENIMIDQIKENPGDPEQEQEHKVELMKKLEDVLLTVEDKEDVEALKNAKKEIVDEFEFSEHEDGPNPPANANNKDVPAAQQTQPAPPPKKKVKIFTIFFDRKKQKLKEMK